MIVWIAQSKAGPAKNEANKKTATAQIKPKIIAIFFIELFYKALFSGGKCPNIYCEGYERTKKSVNTTSVCVIQLAECLTLSIRDNGIRSGYGWENGNALVDVD